MKRYTGQPQSSKRHDVCYNIDHSVHKTDNVQLQYVHTKSQPPRHDNKYTEKSACNLSDTLLNVTSMDLSVTGIRRFQTPNMRTYHVLGHFVSWAESLHHRPPSKLMLIKKPSHIGRCFLYYPCKRVTKVGGETTTLKAAGMVLFNIDYRLCYCKEKGLP